MIKVFLELDIAREHYIKAQKPVYDKYKDGIYGVRMTSIWILIYGQSQRIMTRMSLSVKDMFEDEYTNRLQNEEEPTSIERKKTLRASAAPQGLSVNDVLLSVDTTAARFHLPPGAEK